MQHGLVSAFRRQGRQIGGSHDQVCRIAKGKRKRIFPDLHAPVGPDFLPESIGDLRLSFLCCLEILHSGEILRRGPSVQRVNVKQGGQADTVRIHQISDLRRVEHAVIDLNARISQLQGRIVFPEFIPETVYPVESVLPQFCFLRLGNLKIIRVG